MNDTKILLEKLQTDAKFRTSFKEDSVRERLIAPLLEKLGFVDKGLEKDAPLEVLRSRNLAKPTITGSNSKAQIITPDYTLYLKGKAHCVLDAKSPTQKIDKESKAEAQVYFYAINQELRAPFYALCNGLDFKLYGTSQGLILDLKLTELLEENYAFDTLKYYLSTELNQINPTFIIEQKSDEWYLKKELPRAVDSPQKQAKLRYFGCVAYFTRQSWDVLERNIRHFTSIGDVVLDPFGGSGVTAIEAMMNHRQGIHIDLNPLSIFMTRALAARVDLSKLWDLTEEILKEFEKLRPKNEKEAKVLLKKAKYYPNAMSEDFGEMASGDLQEKILWIPHDVDLPKGSDVDSVLKLFSPLQLAELALLRKLIFKKTARVRDKEEWGERKKLRLALMLAFYNTLSLINLTYHNVPKGGPASAITRYYRYRLAPKPDFLNASEIFEKKIKRVIKGKKELVNSPSFYQNYLAPLSGVIKDFKSPLLEKRSEDLDRTNAFYDKFNGDKIFQADATNLKEIQSASVDFIYTDPPYGAKIPYLDLSAMWNAWLDLDVGLETRKKECIEKGSLNKGREEYKSLMTKSLKEMYRVLKYNRWLAFVFQHQDLQLWQILVEEAQKIGFEYVGSVRQSNGQTSFKKRQYSLTVLSGQLIMYFRKVKEPKNLTKAALGEDILSLALNHIESVIVKNDGADLETLYGEININALENGYLHTLAKDYVDLTPIINENFDYDEKSGKYHIKMGQKLRGHDIPVEKRAHYFIISYLRSCARQNKGVSFDDICLECMPMMKNGVTPSEAMIREILEKIAIKIGDKWHLKREDMGLFAPEELI